MRRLAAAAETALKAASVSAEAASAAAEAALAAESKEREPEKPAPVPVPPAVKRKSYNYLNRALIRELMFIDGTKGKAQIQAAESVQGCAQENEEGA